MKCFTEYSPTIPEECIGDVQEIVQAATAVRDAIDTSFLAGVLVTNSSPPGDIEATRERKKAEGQKASLIEALSRGCIALLDLQAAADKPPQDESAVHESAAAQGADAGGEGDGSAGAASTSSPVPADGTSSAAQGSTTQASLASSDDHA